MFLIVALILSVKRQTLPQHQCLSGQIQSERILCLFPFRYSSFAVLSFFCDLFFFSSSQVLSLANTHFFPRYGLASTLTQAGKQMRSGSSLLTIRDRRSVSWTSLSCNDTSELSTRRRMRRVWNLFISGHF